MTAQNLFHWNESSCQWERVDRVQTYKGLKIETVIYHGDWHYADNHREYRVTRPDGSTFVFGINKQGGNIKRLKSYIDFKLKYNEWGKEKA